MLKGAVNKSYVRPAILYGCEPWCLRKARLFSYEGFVDHDESNDSSNIDKR